MSDQTSDHMMDIVDAYWAAKGIPVRSDDVLDGFVAGWRAGRAYLWHTWLPEPRGVVMSDPSANKALASSRLTAAERDTISAAFGKFWRATVHPGVEKCFEAGWLAHREFVVGEHQVTETASLAVPGLDQEMPARRRPNYGEAFHAVKTWLELNHAASGDEAITNARAEEIVRLCLQRAVKGDK